MSNNATEADWQRVLYGLARLWQRSGIASAGNCRLGLHRRRGDGTADQLHEIAIVCRQPPIGARPARVRPPGN